MRKLILDEHTESCKNKIKNTWLDPHLFCKVNPSKFVFLYDREFYYLEIPNCQKGISSNTTFIEDMLINGNKDTKRLDNYDTYRSQCLDSEFKEHRLRCKELEIKLIEVNYVYSDARGKEYAICTDIKLDQALTPYEDIKKDGEKMKAFLKDCGSEHLIDQVDYLVSQNWYHLSDYEVFKTSEHLIKQFNKQIKTK